MLFFKIPQYHAFLSPQLARQILDQAALHPSIKDLKVSTPGLESPEVLTFLIELYGQLEVDLKRLIEARSVDREFIDTRTQASCALNLKLGLTPSDPEYHTVIGLQDSEGRIVFGPLNQNYAQAGGKPIAPLPDYLRGPHVTLFGPPDSAKLAINAMNSYHRKSAQEPEIVERLLAGQSIRPFWGADDEDSKTPLHEDLVQASQNLTACFEKTLTLEEAGKKYTLSSDHLALPIKRIPGLALPSSFLFYKDNPLPLHLYDFVLHLFHNHHNPRALSFYIPKLETEEEARYIHKMIATAEAMIQKLHPQYLLGSIRLMIVLENPRAILRTHEIIDALYPYFAGASLGWHDYLASMARLAREDSQYRIPVKADPNIVIKHIQASQLLLARLVNSRGGIAVGGMYGILPTSGSRESLQVSLKGFIKDVVSQMKRRLTGFWVAHPDFVRLGLALVEAWKRYENGDRRPLHQLTEVLLDPKYHAEICEFIEGPDVQAVSPKDPAYLASLIVSNIRESDTIANHDPEEIRYNVFQSLQYLTDWLAGNGCVALPTTIEGIAVRVMDDLATAERSRWEVWHEIRHGRFSAKQLIQIVHEEMNFIRRDLSDSKKIVQVKFNERTQKWYPIARQIMLKLMTDFEPAEFATELLLPFTTQPLRQAADPWQEALRLEPEKYRLEKSLEDFDRYFEICGTQRFASILSSHISPSDELAKNLIEGFTLEEVLSAASFHGDIGQSQKTLDPHAVKEQKLVSSAEPELQKELTELGQSYLAKFGFKFLISAQGRTAQELLVELKRRLLRSEQEELIEAKVALWEITEKRLDTLSKHYPKKLSESLEELRQKHQITGASIAINYQNTTQTLCLGEAIQGQKKTVAATLFEIASLSKTIATAFAIEYFQSRGISLQTSVNKLFQTTETSFQLSSDEVRLEHLMNHKALNMHYVPGLPSSEAFPALSELLAGKFGYTPIALAHPPGEVFQYSGGGFIVLEFLLESLEKKPFCELITPFLKAMGLNTLVFDHSQSQGLAHGYMDAQSMVQDGHLNFPLIAAGAYSNSIDVALFLQTLTKAYQNLEGAKAISHDTAVQMLHGSDLGCRDFMGCDIGLGVFVLEAGQNRFAAHQGANEGFRALFLHCFSGPDQGKGLVILCNADNNGVAFIATAAREILERLECHGIDFTQNQRQFDFSKIPQEQIVNMGYKKLLFSAFQPDLPEKIALPGPLDPLAPQNLVVGARIIKVSNQKFARAENLLSPHLPVFDPTLFERQGKVMDSWEGARHNPLGKDSLLIELNESNGAKSIRFVSLSTQFHDGNQVEYVRLLGKKVDHWEEFLPKTALAGHSLLLLDLEQPFGPYHEILIEVFPDGGLTRLGLFHKLSKEIASQFLPLKIAKSQQFEQSIPKSKKPLSLSYLPTKNQVQANLERAQKRGIPIDAANVAFGGELVHASNEHYGPAIQVISPYPPLHMFDGLESARSRIAGHHEEVTLRPLKSSVISSITLDFTFFINNNPLEVSIEGLYQGKWETIAPRTRVKAYAGNKKRFIAKKPKAFDEIKIKTFPDGGINRIHLNS